MSSTSQQAILFARNFLRHPKMLGSMIPSSRFLIDKLMDKIDWKRAKVIVEYGPGVGTITTEILDRMAPDATLIVIEMNQEFVQFLRREIADERFHVVHGSAADVDKMLRKLGIQHADYVISGIPYSTIPDQVRETILQGTYKSLSPNGAFLVYQFTRAVLPYLRRHFGRVHQDFEPLNILPARLFYCTR